MEDLKTGDVITNTDGSVREIVLARLEDLIFTKLLKNNVPVGSVQGPTHIPDAIARGYGKE